MGQSDSQILQEIKDQNTRILSYIEDDVKTGRKGLYSMGQDHEERIKELENEHIILKTEKKWVQWLISGLIAALVSFGKLLVNLIF